MNRNIRIGAMLVAGLATGVTARAQKAEPLFSLLSPKHTQITFNNKLKDTPDHNVMIYSNYYGGAGVGIGDFNQDGLPDIFFAGNLEADQLYLNKGDLVFEDITRASGITDNGGWSSGVLVADVNLDGWQDIYVTRELYDDQPELRKNKLYINEGPDAKGIPQFSEQAAAYGVDNSERTRHAVFLDYDKDGDPDLLLLNQPPNPGDFSPFFNKELILDEYQMKLYANEGTHFNDVTATAGLARTGFPNSATASDFNGDGWTDLFIANDFWIGDWLFLNNGDGTFTEKVQENLRHTSFSSMGVDAGDIDNDGRLDMMVVDMVAEDNYRLKANMSGMNPEAFWKVVEDGGYYQYMFNMLHYNTGDAQFSDIAQMAQVASTDWSWSVLMADYDNDGWKDIHVTNGLMRDIRNTDANKKFKKYVEGELHKYLQAHPNPGDITLWDIVDIDKTMSLVPSEKLPNYIFRNNGNLTFTKMMGTWGMEEKTFSNGAAYADLDLDGDLDLVISNVNDLAYVYENHAVGRAGTHYLRIKPVADQPRVLEMGTKVWVETSQGKQFFELTGARGMYSTSEMVAHFGLGDAREVLKVRVIWPDGKEQLLENVPANQTLEVKYSDAQPPLEVLPEKEACLFSNITGENGWDVRHEENVFDDYTYQVLLPHKMSHFGPCLAKGDINGDGLEDFFLGGAAGKPSQLFVQTPEGGFVPTEQNLWQADKLHEDLGAVLFDADGDADLDLYVSSGGNEFMEGSENYRDRLYINDGQGHFEKRMDLLPDVRQSSSKVYPEDIDQDGDLDLFIGGRHVPWSYPEPASSTLLINQGGRFEDATSKWLPDLKDIGMVNDAAWLDYDQDGWKDLMVVGEWMPLTLFKNTGKGFEKVSGIPDLDDHTGWWFSVKAADIDQDGDTDLIAGNLGLNYKYKASKSEPFDVYYYDFDENGSRDIVLAYYNFGIQYPLRGRSCSSEQVPEIKEKFESYDLFASADVVEVYGKNDLSHALHYSATEFGSVYLENTGDGQFRMHRLPVKAQFSSINDILVDDFDQDGHKDLLVAGNLFEAEVETARNDAGYGLMLKGDGAGHFEALDWQKSGFFVPYDVKSLETLQTSAGPLVLVGCNDAPVQVFKVEAKPAK